MNNKLLRRDFVRLCGLGLTLPMAAKLGAESITPNYRIRTITAGLHLQNPLDPGPAKDAIEFLNSARVLFLDQGYEVQTLRLATQPMQNFLPDWKKSSSIKAIKALDRVAVDNGVVCSIGPVITDDEYHQEFSS